MKIHLILLLFFFPSLVYCSNDNKTPNSNRNEVCHDMTVVHKFTNNQEQILGLMCTNTLMSSNENYFDQMYIVSNNDGKKNILYEIEKNKLIRSDKSIDAIVAEKGFLGYQILIRNKNYVVLSCCGNNIADDITIEWNSEKKIFELLKTP